MAEDGLHTKFVMITLIGALILSAVLLGFRGTAIKNAYDTSSAYNVTLANGTVVTETPTVFGGGSFVALLYSIAAALVWIIAIVVIVMKFMGKL